MICYEDRTWCKTESCKHYHECEKTFRFAMHKQAQEVKDVRDRIPYAVRDMSEVCADYEVAE